MFDYGMQLGNSVFDDLNRLHRELGSLFGSDLGRSNIRAVAAGSVPRINVGTTADATYIYAFVPGMDAQSLDVSMQHNVVTIGGECPVDAMKAGERAGYHLRERPRGKFRRALSLPDDTDPNQVEAVYKDGLLKIKVGRRGASASRRIAVQNA